MPTQREMPQYVDAENIRRFETRDYRKTTTTKMVGPITLTRMTRIETSEGGYDLLPEWEGYIAIDADGKPYPVEKAIHEATYEEVQ